MELRRVRAVLVALIGRDPELNWTCGPQPAFTLVPPQPQDSSLAEIQSIHSSFIN
jgi:hypothetical protein